MGKVTALDGNETAVSQVLYELIQVFSYSGMQVGQLVTESVWTYGHIPVI